MPKEEIIMKKREVIAILTAGMVLTGSIIGCGKSGSAQAHMVASESAAAHEYTAPMAEAPAEAEYYEEDGSGYDEGYDVYEGSAREVYEEEDCAAAEECLEQRESLVEYAKMCRDIGEVDEAIRALEIAVKRTRRPEVFFTEDDCWDGSPERLLEELKSKKEAKC